MTFPTFISVRLLYQTMGQQSEQGFLDFPFRFACFGNPGLLHSTFDVRISPFENHKHLPNVVFHAGSRKPDEILLGMTVVFLEIKDDITAAYYKTRVGFNLKTCSNVRVSNTDFVFHSIITIDCCVTICQLGVYEMAGFRHHGANVRFFGDTSNTLLITFPNDRFYLTHQFERPEETLCLCAIVGTFSYFCNQLTAHQ